jgi:hypothetical protein
MILIRDIFYLKFGKARDAQAMLGELKEIGKKLNYPMGRALTDLVTSHSYTLILGSEWKSLSDWENMMKNESNRNAWTDWYQKFIPLCDSASREILNVLE